MGLMFKNIFSIFLKIGKLSLEIGTLNHPEAVYIFVMLDLLYHKEVFRACLHVLFFPAAKIELCDLYELNSGFVSTGGFKEKHVSLQYGWTFKFVHRYIIIVHLYRFQCDI